MSKLSKKNNKRIDHRIPLVRWSLHKYKCLWGVGDKDQSSSFQEGASHTYTLRLGYSGIYILYIYIYIYKSSQKKKKLVLKKKILNIICN